MIRANSFELTSLLHFKHTFDSFATIIATCLARTLIFASIILLCFKRATANMLVNYPSRTSIYQICLYIKKKIQEISYYYLFINFLPLAIRKCLIKIIICITSHITFRMIKILFHFLLYLFFFIIFIKELKNYIILFYYLIVHLCCTWNKPSVSINT